MFYPMNVLVDLHSSSPRTNLNCLLTKRQLWATTKQLMHQILFPKNVYVRAYTCMCMFWKCFSQGYWVLGIWVIIIHYKIILKGYAYT